MDSSPLFGLSMIVLMFAGFACTGVALRWLINRIEYSLIGQLHERERARILAFRVTLRAVRRNARALIGRGCSGSSFPFIVRKTFQAVKARCNAVSSCKA